MSHLASQLGAPRETVQLARAADEGSKGQASPQARASFYAAEARGHAVQQDVRATELALSRAAEELDRAPEANGSAPSWVAYFDQHYLADAAAHCYRDLGHARQAEEQALAALAGMGPEKVRRRVMDMFVLASARVLAGEVEAGCATATDAVRLSGRIRSARGVESLRDFERRLAPHASVASVREFRAFVAMRRPGEPINA